VGQKKKSHLAEVKIALAEKWEQKAKITTSTPARKTFTNRATRYRRQAEEIQRGDSK
jgi:hypothetical protein